MLQQLVQTISSTAHSALYVSERNFGATPGHRMFAHSTVSKQVQGIHRSCICALPRFLPLHSLPSAHTATPVPPFELPWLRPGWRRHVHRLWNRPDAALTCHSSLDWRGWCHTEADIPYKHKVGHCCGGGRSEVVWEFKKGNIVIGLSTSWLAYLPLCQLSSLTPTRSNMSYWLLRPLAFL